MIPQLRSYLLENWTQLPLGRARPNSLTFMMQATGVSKVCCYLFADDSCRPQWVAKMMRSPNDNALLAREYGLVQELRKRGSAFVRATIPGPLLTTSIAGHLVGVEAYLDGQSMDGLLATKTLTDTSIRKYLDLAVNWLLQSQRDTGTQHDCLNEEQVRVHFIEPIMQLRQHARLKNDEEKYLEQLVIRARALTRYALPLRFSHGDFQPGNIFVRGDTIQVIDWEFGTLTALPLLDVFSFMTRAYARHQGLEEIDGKLDDYLEAFEAVFFEGGSFAGLTGEYTHRACEQLKIHPAWMNVLFPFFIVTEAIKYFIFLRHRSERSYVYLLDCNGESARTSYIDRLARQKNIWLLAHLMCHERRLIFNQLV